MSEDLTYLNGTFVAGAAARLPVWDYGIVQGATVTDLVRTFGGRAYRLDEHLDRFLDSLSVLSIELPEDRGRIAEIVREIIRRVRGRRDGNAATDFGVVMFATPGRFGGYAGFLEPPNSLDRPTLCVHPFPLRFAEYREGYRNGIALVTPNIPAIPEETISPTIKVRSRLHWYLAGKAARAIDPEAAALLCDRDGYVTETATGNLFAVMGDRLLTPRAERTLPGISQQVIVELCIDEGLAVERADLTVDELQTADEILLSSSTYCLLPVSRLNQKPVGSGRPGPVFERLIRRWSVEVGVDIVAQAEKFGSP